MLGYALEAYVKTVKDANAVTLADFLVQFSDEAFGGMKTWIPSLYYYREFLEPYETEKDPLERGPEVALEDGEEVTEDLGVPGWIEVVKGAPAALDEADLSELP